MPLLSPLQLLPPLRTASVGKSVVALIAQPVWSPPLQAVAAAALAGANLRGLGLPPHIEDPTSAAAPVVTPGAMIDGLSTVPTNCLCVTGMVTAHRLSNDAEYADVSYGVASAGSAACCSSSSASSLATPDSPEHIACPVLLLLLLLHPALA